jgi:hypothetical protein
VDEREGLRLHPVTGLRRSARAACAVACAALVSVPAVAWANGRFPAAQQLAPSPSDPNVIAMMATFGVVLSQDDGANWDWVCEGAVGYQSNENPMLGITQGGTILLGAFEGLGLSTNAGCAWSFAPAAISSPVVDLVVEKSDPHTALILAAGYAGQDDAGATYASRIYATHDDGAHFAPVGAPLAPDLLPQTIEVAPSDASRVYVSGTRRIGGQVFGVLLASSDGAQTFTEADFPLISGDAGLVDRNPYIAAVDPSNPDRVYVRVDNIDGTRLLVSDDGTKTTRQVWQAQGSLVGFALSPDGSKIFVGSANDGLHVATKDALDFTTQIWPGQVLCLAFQGARLLACSNDVGTFVVGASTDEGATWTPLLHLACVRGPLACGPTSQVTTQCAPNWLTQQQNLGGPDPRCAADAGADASTPGGDAGAPKSGGGKSGCAMGLPGPAGLPSLLAVAALAGVGLARRKKQKKNAALG